MQIIIEAFLLGLVGGIVPGSILTILLVSVIQGGFKSGFRAFSWSLAAELTVVSLLLMVLVHLPVNAKLFNYLGLAGGLVLFYLGLQVFKLSKIDKPEETSEVFTWKQIYSLAATNAPLYIFWVTVCAPLIWQLAEQISLSSSALYFMIAFELGWAISTFAIMLIFVKTRSVLTNPHIMKKVFIGVAFFMFLLGLRMFYSSVATLIG